MEIDAADRDDRVRGVPWRKAGEMRSIEWHQSEFFSHRSHSILFFAFCTGFGASLCGPQRRGSEDNSIFRAIQTPDILYPWEKLHIPPRGAELPRPSNLSH